MYRRSLPAEVPGGAFCALKTATRTAKHSANVIEIVNGETTATLNTVDSDTGDPRRQ